MNQIRCGLSFYANDRPYCLTRAPFSFYYRSSHQMQGEDRGTAIPHEAIEAHPWHVFEITSYDASN